MAVGRARGGGEEGERVRWTAQACVWQNTGEDWDKAQLHFSTQRPSLGVEPPALRTDRLAVRRKREVLQVQTRQQKVERAGLGRGDGSGGAPAEPEVPGIDDGGEVLTLPGQHPVTVPSDGRPTRVDPDEIRAKAAEAATHLFTRLEEAP